MKGDDRTGDPPQEPGPCPVGGRAAQHHPDPQQRADRGQEDGSLRLMATDLDLQVDESVPAQVAQAGAITVHFPFFDIVRKLPEAARSN